MLFPTLPFGVFFLCVFALAWIVRKDNELRKIVLLLASWVFYGAWDMRFVALLIGSAGLNWAVARAITHLPSRGRVLLIAGVTFNLLVLGVFKYYGFFMEQVSGVLHMLRWDRDLPLMQMLLPIGVSFYTFQGVSYLVDVRQGKVQAARLLDVLLLMSFFPHLVAGPIVRAADLLPQLAAPVRLHRKEAAAALLLIVWGLFKKIVIASPLATRLVDPVFAEAATRSSADLLAGVYGYAVQIYCDFSAYSDIAIGVAGLLGYRFPYNFNQPYRAASLQDFWRRWHISLSSWLRDYLYIPLGGSRRGPWRQCANLMVTMVLGGLWHGASAKFLVWGALHGSVLSGETLWRRVKPARWPSAPAWLGALVTFHVVCLGWIYFRAQSFEDAGAVLSGLVQTRGALTVGPFLLGTIALGLLLNHLPPLALQRIARRVSALPAPAMGALTAAAILMIDAARPDGVAPFIYYQF